MVPDQSSTGGPVRPGVRWDPDLPADTVVQSWRGQASLAEAASGVMAEPDVEVWAPGFTTVTVLPTVQVKPADPEYPDPSVAVRVTDEVPDVVGVPVMAPEESSTDRPAGRPVAV